METTTVLDPLSLEQKLVTIPNYEDYEYLEQEFWKVFKIDQQSQQENKVLFQCYNKEWEEFVDIEYKDTVKHMEKLKAILVPFQPAKRVSILTIYHYVHATFRKVFSLACYCDTASYYAKLLIKVLLL